MISRYPAFRLCLAVLGLAAAGFSRPATAVEYGYTPRPEVVRGADPAVLSLDGVWKFQPAPPPEFWTLDEASAATWPAIRVPGDWTMQGFAVEPGTAAGYLRTVTIPDSWAGRRVLLRFDGVQSAASVWVNGRPAGSHEGGFNAFELDVTVLVRPGAPATVAVAVRNESTADELASGTQYAAYQFGGITRKAYLMAVPELHVARLRIRTDLDIEYRDARLSVDVSLRNAGRTPARGVDVEFALLDPDGRPVGLDRASLPAGRLAPGAAADRTFEANVKAPPLWDAEHPRLHTLVVTLRSGGRTVETVARRFGFRKVEAVWTGVFVNGLSVKVRGVNRHETHPLLGRSLTPELERRDAALFRAANVNYIRTSHYPPAEEFLDACDELGLFVECEAPLVWIGHAANARWKTESSDDPKYYPFIERAVGEMIAFHERHPSIVFWSLANESAWGPNWVKAKAWADALDPTRPKTFHDQAYGEFNNRGSASMPVANYHYPGPRGPELAEMFPRPLLYGEYCHLNCYNRVELAADPGLRDEWGNGLSRMWEKMFASQTVIGGAIWSGLDDVFQLPEGRAVGYGEWGPLDGWRREKPEYWHLKKAYSPVRIVPEVVAAPAAGEPIRLFVENRHDFTDLSELNIEWRRGEARGLVRMALAPGRTGVLSIPAPAGEAGGRPLRLDFRSPRGFLIDSYEIPVGARAVPDPPFMPAAPGPIVVREEADRFVAAGPSAVWTIDKATGKLGAETEGVPILTGGPVLMLLPQTSGPCVTDFSLDVKPLNDTCSGWIAESVRAVAEAGAVVLTVKGRFKEAGGGYRIRIDGSGSAEVEYAFAVNESIDPRQWGLVFYLPREMDTLDWSRRSRWSVYPENHIGRPRGTAKALAAGRDFRFRRAPDWDWKDDQTALGSNDFRSTKADLDWAALTDTRGRGLLVISDERATGRPTEPLSQSRSRIAGAFGAGTLSLSRSRIAVAYGAEPLSQSRSRIAGAFGAARAFVDGGRIGWLIAGFNTGGGDIFFAPHHRVDDRPLEKGDEIEGRFVMRLLAGRR